MQRKLLVDMFAYGHCLQVLRFGDWVRNYCSQTHAVGNIVFVLDCINIAKAPTAEVMF